MTLPIVIKLSTLYDQGASIEVSTVAIEPTWRGSATFETVVFHEDGRQSREFMEFTVEEALWRHRAMERKVIMGKVKWT